MNLEINTLNLIIKKPNKNDISSLVKELNNWNISKWLVEVPYPYLINDAYYWLNKTEQNTFSFNIYKKNKLIGGISLTNKLSDTRWELGYWIGENYWGKGYATEACENLIEYFFSNTSNNLIYASHMKDNIKSKKIIIKLGFKLVKAGKKFSISRNEIIDNLNYELLKP
jgi:RimJ/RimL family protein N-acetyltransferase